MQRQGLSHHFYADDSQVYLVFKPSDSQARQDALTRVETGFEDTQTWMSNNKLKLNGDKTEAIVFTSKHNVKHTDTIQLPLGDTTVPTASSVKSLGVTFDSLMKMEQHVNSTCRSAYAQPRNIGRIRRCRTNDATKSLVNGMVSSRLDYCNALLHGLPTSLPNKLQRVQNTAARIITRTSKYSHITPILMELHWLPIQSRVHHQILLNTFKALHEEAPMYITGQ